MGTCFPGCPDWVRGLAAICEKAIDSKVRILLVLSIAFLALSAASVRAERFALKGKAIACAADEGVLDNIPILMEDKTVIGVLFKFHEDAVEVYTDWKDGFLKSGVPVSYKETGRHYIWTEDVFVPVADRLNGVSQRQIRKHTLNRFAWTGRYASQSQDAVSWVDSGQKITCQVLSHVEADEKVEQIRRQASK